MNVNLPDILKNTQRLMSDNSPAILTAIGVTGTITTAILTGKAVLDAADLLHDHYSEETREDNVSVKGAFGAYPIRDNIQMTWKCYIPPLAVGTATVACIIGANRMGARQTAVMATAYSVTEKAFTEYKDKVVEQIGVKKEEQVRDSIAQDRVNAQPPSAELLMVGEGKVPCYESITGRYFESDMETIRRAVNDINQQCLSEGSASLNEFFYIIGLPNTTMGDELGWNMDVLLEAHYSAVLVDNKPVMSIGYRSMPFPNFNRLGG